MLKMKKQGVEFDEVFDLFAMRIILESEPENEKSDCWKIILLLLTFISLIQATLRDWISVPKSNGYESLHTTVVGQSKMEGRGTDTDPHRMDEIAEKGFAPISNIRE